MNIFITGPARGIGAALARALAARGERLALAGLEPEVLASLAGELGPEHVWFECDVTDQASLERAVAGAVQAFGGIDVVVANAGIASHGTVAVSPMEVLARVVDVNLTGVIRTVHATLPHVVASRGYVLLIASAAAIGAAPGIATYAGTKAGVEQFGNSLRLEVAHKGVTVGVAYPCWIDTDLVRDTQRELAYFNRMLKKMPGPFGKVTSLETCTSLLLEGIGQRSRRIFIPKSLGFFSAMRHFLVSRLADRAIRSRSGRGVEAMEEEVRSRGTWFGEHSVERK